VTHFGGSDACVAPVLTLEEAPGHPHNVERGTFVDLGGVVQPGPAPRYSRTATGQPTEPRPVGADGEAVLAGIGYSPDDILLLRREGALL
jgi:alpha-methylacyl-CoA racemase